MSTLTAFESLLAGCVERNSFGCSVMATPECRLTGL